MEISLLDSFTNSRKDYWKIIHFVQNKDSTSSIPPLTNRLESGDTVYYTTDKEKADCLNIYFTSVSHVDDSEAILPPFVEKTNQYLDNVIIMEPEVKDILDILNVNKASGPDMISNRMLKYTSTSVSKPLSILYNRSLPEGIFPEPWKHSQVVPIFKKGERTIPANYPPVSLLSNVGKVFERVLFKHIYNHLYINNLLYKYQSGFLPGHSTTLQLIDIYHHICQSFDEKQYSCMVYCDISKAFDRVWHSGLLFKLRQNGIKEKIRLDFKLPFLKKAKSVNKFFSV